MTEVPDMIFVLSGRELELLRRSYDAVGDNVIFWWQESEYRQVVVTSVRVPMCEVLNARERIKVLSSFDDKIASLLKVLMASSIAWRQGLNIL